MDTNLIIFFDLEETLIWDWTENRNLTCARFPCLKEWVIEQPPFRAGLFSWAVWNQKDVDEFNELGGIRQDIEATFKFKFDDDLIITHDDLFEKMKAWLKMPKLRDPSDIFDFFKKRQCIEEVWLREFNQPNTKVILLDDTVEDIVLHRQDVENNTLELVNPWTIIKKDMI